MVAAPDAALDAALVGALLLEPAATACSSLVIAAWSDLSCWALARALVSAVSFC